MALELIDSTHALIETAARRGAEIVGIQRGPARRGIAVAATRPTQFVDPPIDPVTGYPIDATLEDAGFFLADDIVESKPVGN